MGKKWIYWESSTLYEWCGAISEDKTDLARDRVKGPWRLVLWLAYSFFFFEEGAEITRNWATTFWPFMIALWASLLAQLVKNLPANTGDLGSIPGLGRSPGERNGCPLQYSGLENSMDCSSWGRRVGHDWATFTLFTEEIINPKEICNPKVNTLGEMCWRVHVHKAVWMSVF